MFKIKERKIMFIIAVMFVLMFVFPQLSFAENNKSAFGFVFGETINEIENKGYTLKKVDTRLGLHMYTTKTAPKKFTGADFYLLGFGEGAGLIKVVMFTEETHTSRNIIIKELYNEIVEGLKLKVKDGKVIEGNTLSSLEIPFSDAHARASKYQGKIYLTAVMGEHLHAYVQIESSDGVTLFTTTSFEKNPEFQNYMDKQETKRAEERMSAF